MVKNQSKVMLALRKDVRSYDLETVRQDKCCATEQCFIYRSILDNLVDGNLEAKMKSVLESVN